MYTVYFVMGSFLLWCGGLACVRQYHHSQHPRFSSGGPLASLLFALVLHVLLIKIRHRIPSIYLNGWFLDDGILGGKKEDLKEAAKILLDDGPIRRLHISTELTTPGNAKSSIWCPLSDNDDPDPLNLGITRIMEPGLSHLRAPLS